MKLRAALRPLSTRCASWANRHFHEPVESGTISSLPKPLRKLARSLFAIFTGRRANKAGKLVPIDRLEPRNYLMVLCSIDPPAYGA